MQVHKITAPAPGTVITVPGFPVAFQPQDGINRIWYEAEGRVEWFVTIVGTGWDVPEGYRHRATTQNGQFVWHMYARPVLS